MLAASWTPVGAHHRRRAIFPFVIRRRPRRPRAQGSSGFPRQMTRVFTGLNRALARQTLRLRPCCGPPWALACAQKSPRTFLHARGIGARAGHPRVGPPSPRRTARPRFRVFPSCTTQMWRRKPCLRPGGPLWALPAASYATPEARRQNGGEGGPQPTSMDCPRLSTEFSHRQAARDIGWTMLSWASCCCCTCWRGCRSRSSLASLAARAGDRSSAGSSPHCLFRR